MELRRYYRALLSRDRRFDGKFFVAVRTTGVYCRPICPAPRPKARNVRFFPCAAAAEAAGFRPCRRCRPETAAGTPAWLGSSVTVSRALRMIHEGALDHAGVEQLAQRLGVGDRHLRRLFRQHLGATPAAIAQTRRAHFARLLLDQTDLTMTKVASSAGYSSLRRFNAAMQEAFLAPPSSLRKRTPHTFGRGASRGAGAGRPGEHRIRLRIPYRPPYDWGAMLDFLRARALPGVEEIVEDCYRRTVRCGDDACVVEVRPDQARCEVELSVDGSASAELIALVAAARRLFDLEADPLPIHAHLRRDRALARLLDQAAGIRVPGAWDRLETAIRVVIGQQISVKAATTVAARLARALGDPLTSPNGSLTHVFPDARRLLVSNLDGLGLTGRRIATIRALAAAVEDGSLELAAAADLDGLLARLQTIAGVGPWTAAMLAMRVFGEPDAFAAGDLGVRKALAEGATLPSEKVLLERARAWRPWRAYALATLWRVGAAGAGRRGGTNLRRVS